MAELTLESLGLSQDEIAERVVERIADRVLSEWVDAGDNEDQVVGHSQFQSALENKVRERVDCAIDEIAAKNVLPNVASYVENLTLQETNKWGEKSGEPMTFVEYLVKRAEHYLTEKVDFQGRAKGQDSFSWRGTQTRVSHLVHEHLHYSIQNAMEDALKSANSNIVKGLEETVKLKLREIADDMKVKVETRR